MALTPGAIYRLFYCSRQTPAAAANLDFAVQQMIDAAMARNRAVGVTGLLVTVRGSFVQALEGDVDAVRTTYARLSMDWRHHDLHIISQGWVPQRLFGEWNMCARALAPTDKAILDLLDGKGDFDPQALTAPGVQRLLTTIAAVQRRSALTAVEDQADLKTSDQRSATNR